MSRPKQQAQPSSIPALHCTALRSATPAATCFACHRPWAASSVGQQSARLHEGSCAEPILPSLPSTVYCLCTL